jgi:isopentenyl-diphosphate delta-isomerase
MSDTSKRKQAHIDLCLNEDVERGDAGFGRYRLLPEAFPEMALDDADPTTRFLDRRLSFPFVIASMSGGVGGGFDLNRRLAKAAQEAGVALGLGSLRPAIDDPAYLAEYDVRTLAPDVPLLGNVSAWQLRDRSFRERLLEVADDLRLDGLFVHVNAAQELIQPEGERDFSGALEAVLALLQEKRLPVFLKEVGTGLVTGHLVELVEAGLAGIDVAGRGGTDWVRVEALRTENPVARRIAGELSAFGMPTADAVAWADGKLREIAGEGERLPRSKTPPERPWLIASGGIRAPADMALALGLGADLVSAALPVLRAAADGDQALADLLAFYREGLRHLMLLSGCQSVEKLRSRVV